MNKKITEERFNEIKKFLNTPIVIKPSIKYVADEFGYSSGTISLINRFDTYKKYKEWQSRHIKRYLDNEWIRMPEERKSAVEEIAKFNNE
jgi:hypothetical protein